MTTTSKLSKRKFDVVILNTVEVSALPEVAQAAPEDLADSLERLKEVLEWVEGV